ncbi:integumentary mucin C.1-like isoform X2 [Haliotis rufescens]|uniref:integumentary mucin C.1-like isoform X2 n=1 Tax=Haliotis rufescens TaxID=6454 RepID=UPI001EB094DE|nr:integumentary mucin C.1-like isoform X2 [Haliotis rufescens]
MSKRLNDKTRSDMSGQGSSGDGSGDMTAELWGEVYDLMCLKMKTDDAYAKLRAKGDDMMCEQIRSKMRKLTEPQKGASKKTIKKIQKKKTSKPTAVVVPTAAATPTTTTAPVTTTTTTTTTAATATTAAVTTDIETKGTSFLKPATPATPAKRRLRKKLSLKIPPQEQLTPDVSSAQSVLEQWWEQTPREPTYSPNAPVTMATGDRNDHEALKLVTLPSMDLDTLPLLEASWSQASPEDVHVYSSGRP